MKYVIVGSSKLPVPELAREALRAAAGALLHPAATRPQSITANSPGHLLASPRDVGPAAGCPGLAPAHCGQQGEKQAGGGGRAWLCATLPPRCLGRSHEKTLGQWILRGRRPDGVMEGGGRQGKGFGLGPSEPQFLHLGNGEVHSLFHSLANLFNIWSINTAGFPHLPLHFNLLHHVVLVEACEKYLTWPRYGARKGKFVIAFSDHYG